MKAESELRRWERRGKYHGLGKPIQVISGSRVRDVLREFVKKGNTASCVKEVSLLDDEVILESSALTPSRASDLYLLALAAANDARFTTFDTRIPATTVAGCSAALEIIPIS